MVFDKRPLSFGIGVLSLLFFGIYMIPVSVILKKWRNECYIFCLRNQWKGGCRRDKTDRERENFMLVSGVSFSGCENFFENKEKGHERMRKKSIKFEDEYIESNTLDVLNIKSGRVLKSQAKELRYFEIFENNLKHIRTLEDLEKFPKLEVIVNHGIRDYETEEGEEQFEESFKPTQQEYERYQKMLKKICRS